MEETEEKVLVVAEGFLGLCFQWKPIAARMLMMCTWKNMDLEEGGEAKKKKGKVNILTSIY